MSKSEKWWDNRQSQCQRISQVYSSYFSTSPALFFIQWEKAMGRVSFCDWPRVCVTPPFLRSWREFTVSFFSQPHLQKCRLEGAVCCRRCCCCAILCLLRRLSCFSFAQHWVKPGGSDKATCGLHVHRKSRLVMCPSDSLFVFVSALFYLRPGALGDMCLWHSLALGYHWNHGQEMYSGLYWSTAEQVGLVLFELQQSKYVVNVHHCFCSLSQNDICCTKI